MREGGWGHNGKEAERLVEHKSFQGREGEGFPLFFHGEKRRMGHFPIPTEAKRGKRRSPFFPSPFLGKDVEAGRERGRFGLWLWFWWRRKWGGSSGDVTLIPPVDPIQLPFYTSEEAAGSINGKERGQSGDLDALGKEEEKESFPIFFVCVRSIAVVSYRVRSPFGIAKKGKLQCFYRCVPLGMRCTSSG